MRPITPDQIMDELIEETFHSFRNLGSKQHVKTFHEASCKEGIDEIRLTLVKIRETLNQDGYLTILPESWVSKLKETNNFLSDEKKVEETLMTKIEEYLD